MRPLIRLLRLLLPGVLIVLLTGAPVSGADDPVGVWPLRPEPEIVARFDPPTSPYGPGHRGVDLLGHAGQRVHTALAGTVTYAGPLAGRGVVVVSHGETRTTYEPVAASVAVGDAVDRGTVLGALQVFGSHCAPRVCLHWGWLRGETYLDPLRLVGEGPVRLLPLWRDQPVARSPSEAPLRLPYGGWRPLVW
jgi:murein DD-endopeptidase MepM/ murein hydrolase activator NlpD